MDDVPPSMDDMHGWHFHPWIELSAIRFCSCLTKFWGNWLKLVIYVSKMWWMTITYMNEQISSMVKSFIREWHPWMVKCYRWMKVPSVNAIYEWHPQIKKLSITFFMDDTFSVFFWCFLAATKLFKSFSREQFIKEKSVASSLRLQKFIQMSKFWTWKNFDFLKDWKALSFYHYLGK